MLRMCLLTSVVLAASPALAFDTKELGQGGSLPLSDLDALIGQSAPLKQEVTAALAAAKKKPGDVICSGNRFPINGSISAACGRPPIPAIFRANG